MKRAMILACLAVSLFSPLSDAFAAPSLPCRRIYRLPVDPFPGGGGVPTYQLRAGDPKLAVTPDDLASDWAVKAGPGVQKILAEVGKDPYAAYRWVRDRVEYLPYFGVKAGAEGVAWSLVGNDFDQASLLAALLRSQGIPTRFVYGVVRVEAKVAADWCGMATAEEAYQFLVQGGVPVRAILVSEIVRYLEVNHCWLEARVPLTNPGNQGPGEGVWVPLDPSFKRHSVNRGQDLFTQLNFQQEDFLLDYLQVPGEGSPEDYFRDLLRAKLAEYGNVTSLGDTAWRISVIPEGDGSLPTGMPPELNVLGTIWEEALIPEVYHYRIRLTLWDGHNDGAGITPGDIRVTIPSAFFSEHSLTVAYIPAMAEDQALADGIPSGSPMDMAVRGEIRLRPRLLVDGKPIGEFFSGDFLESGIPGFVQEDQTIAANIGFHQKLLVETLAPAKDPADTLPLNMGAVERELQVGGIYALGCTGGLVSAGRMQKEAEELRRLQTEGTVQEVFSASLSVAALQYLHKTSLSDSSIAALLGIRHFEEPLLMLCGIHPTGGFDPGGVFYDVYSMVMALVSRDGRADRERTFMFLTGLQGSYYEHRVLSDVFQTTAVSAVRILKHMQSLGLSPLVLDGTDPNLGPTLGGLVGLSLEQKEEILAKVMGQGWKLIIPPQAATLERWTGWGYIIWDPNSGAGGYMISGGLAGGNISLETPAYYIGLWRYEDEAKRQFWVAHTFWIDPEFGKYYFQVSYIATDILPDKFLVSVAILPTDYPLPTGPLTFDEVVVDPWNANADKIEFQKNQIPINFYISHNTSFRVVGLCIKSGEDNKIFFEELVLPPNPPATSTGIDALEWTATGGSVSKEDETPTVFDPAGSSGVARLIANITKAMPEFPETTLEYGAVALITIGSSPALTINEKPYNAHTDGLFYVAADELKGICNYSLPSGYTIEGIYKDGIEQTADLCALSSAGKYVLWYKKQAGNHYEYGEMVLIVVKVNIQGYQQGTVALPGELIDEDYEENPNSLKVGLNDDNDDAVESQGHKDNQDTSISSADDDLVKVDLQIQPDTIGSGTVEFAVIPGGAIRAFRSDGAAELSTYSVSLADPQGDLAALAGNADGLSLFVEGISDSADAVLSITYKHDGIIVAMDEVHLCTTRYDLPSESPAAEALDHQGHAAASSYWDIIGPKVIGFDANYKSSIRLMERGIENTPYFVSRAQGSGDNARTRYFLIADTGYVPYSPVPGAELINGELDSYWYNASTHTNAIWGNHNEDGRIVMSFPNYRAFDYPIPRYDDYVLSSKTKLYICLYDLDDNQTLGEIEKIRVKVNNSDPNGHVTVLSTGTNTANPDSAWQVIAIEFPTEMLLFPIPTEDGQYPQPAMNTVTLEVDQLDKGWAVEVDWAVMEFDAMSPMILIHGAGVSDEFWHTFAGFVNDLMETDFLDAIENRDIPHDVSISVDDPKYNMDGDASIGVGGNILQEEIPRRCRQHGTFVYNAICHSKGGLWFRDALKKMADAEETRNLSLGTMVTLATPHMGSVLASYVVSFIQEFDYNEGKELTGYLPLGGIPPLDYAQVRAMWWPPDPANVLANKGEYLNRAYRDLRPINVGMFNETNVGFMHSHGNQDGSIPRYYALTADADNNGNAIIDDGLIWDEYFPLDYVRTLQADVGYEDWFTEVYTVLRQVSSFDSSVSEGTISFSNIVNETTPQPNDLYVTFDSGRGVSKAGIPGGGSLADLYVHVPQTTWWDGDEPDETNHGTICSEEVGDYLLNTNNNILIPMR